MAVDLVISYRHHGLSLQPLSMGAEAVEQVALDVRRQLGLEDGRRIAADLALLTSIRAVQVNGIRYGLEWHVGGPLTGEDGRAVLGVCEYDPDGLPESALICVNPEPVNGCREIMLSTAVHETGHGIFDAAGWIAAARRAAQPGLFQEAGPRERRVFRTLTPDEAHHLSTSGTPGSEAFFREVRANGFMGTFLVPRRHLFERLHHHCAVLGIRAEALRPRAERADLLGPAASSGAPGSLDDERRSARLMLEPLLKRLGRDFNVTARFIQVRLARYQMIDDPHRQGEAAA